MPQLAWVASSGIATVLKLDYLAPPPELLEFVSAYYHFSFEGEQLDEIERADVAQLRFVYQGEGQVAFPDGSSFDYPRHALLGPRNCYSKLIARGPIRVIGAGILPVAWSTLTSLPADKYVGKVIDAAQMFGDQLVDVASRMERCESFQESCDVFSAFLLERIRASSSAPLWFTRAVNDWLESDISPEIEPLLASTGLAQRQLERWCRAHYGAPPRLLIRKFKALRTASAIARGEASWQDYAAENYYDHSHCIRDVKEFTGMTPHAIQEKRSPLSTVTFGRAQLEGEIARLSSGT
jgi:AraC-like DNA-binding protein